MKAALILDPQTAAQNRSITAAIAQQGGRLRSFIRKRVADPGEAEYILQEVFYELVQSYRMVQPVEQVGAWLFQVARNRITDLFRRKRPQPLSALAPAAVSGDGGDEDLLDQLLAAPEAGPEWAYTRSVLLDELTLALDELPRAQREVFVAHELEGRSFKEMAAETGLPVNTLLARKHYAVTHLRARLQNIYDEFTTP